MHTNHIRISAAALACSVLGIASSANAAGLLFSDQTLTTPLATRSFATSGEPVTVFIDACTTSAEISFSESERKTRIASDFQQILKKAVAALAPAPACQPGETRPTAKEYTLKYTKAVLKVKATSSDGASTQEEVSITTGPTEHWYLGVDLPITDSKTVKYDSTSKSLLPNGSGHQLYLSINYFLGDDLFLAETQPALKRFSAKLLIAAQSKPLDSVGLGLGYRLPKIGSLDLNSFEFFAGRFWTKQDAILNGVGQLNTSTKAAWKVGISYNLSDGLGWLTAK